MEPHVWLLSIAGLDGPWSVDITQCLLENCCSDPMPSQAWYHCWDLVEFKRDSRAVVRWFTMLKTCKSYWNASQLRQEKKLCPYLPSITAYPSGVLQGQILNNILYTAQGRVDMWTMWTGPSRANKITTSHLDQMRLSTSGCRRCLLGRVHQHLSHHVSTNSALAFLVSLED